jgi:hypothetical protein
MNWYMDWCAQKRILETALHEIAQSWGSAKGPSSGRRWSWDELWFDRESSQDDEPQ